MNGDCVTVAIDVVARKNCTDVIGTVPPEASALMPTLVPAIDAFADRHGDRDRRQPQEAVVHHLRDEHVPRVGRVNAVLEVFGVTGCRRVKVDDRHPLLHRHLLDDRIDPASTVTVSLMPKLLV